MESSGYGIYFGPLSFSKIKLPFMSAEDREDSHIEIILHDKGAMGTDEGERLYEIPCLIVGKGDFNISPVSVSKEEYIIVNIITERRCNVELK